MCIYVILDIIDRTNTIVSFSTNVVKGFNKLFFKEKKFLMGDQCAKSFINIV